MAGADRYYAGYILYCLETQENEAVKISDFDKFEQAT